MITVDRQTIIQLIGSLMNNPSLLSDVDKYQLTPNDFSETLDRFIFSAIYNLYGNGAEKIHTVDIDNYLSTNVYAKKLIEENNGLGFLQDCEAYCEPNNFNYYYNRFKKLTLLRELSKTGKDVSSIYSDDPLDDNHNVINERFERLSTTDIINQLKNEVAVLEDRYASNSQVTETTAATGMRDLLEELKIKPEMGLPLQGDMFNTVCRGGRLGKLYLRSAPTSVGKSRNMVGDACGIAYPVRWNNTLQKWEATGGGREKVLYVMTEQDPAEIRTMVLSYLTGINEENFLYSRFSFDEEERVETAIKIMEQYDNLLFAHIPDPCASVVENLFQRYNFQHDVHYFFYDYIFSSPAMLNEYRDLKLQEYAILRIFTTKLKDLAVKLNSFIMTSTQVTDSGEEGFKDEHAIQSSKSIANLVDLGCVMTRPGVNELSVVADYDKQYSLKPNLITDVYKNRRGKHTQIRIWSCVDLGTCRKWDLFVTDRQNQPITNFDIADFTAENEAEMKELEDFYNHGIVSDTKAADLLTQFEQNLGEPNKTEKTIEAFGDFEETKKRVKDVSWDDLS